MSESKFIRFVLGGKASTLQNVKFDFGFMLGDLIYTFCCCCIVCVVPLWGAVLKKKYFFDVDLT